MPALHQAYVDTGSRGYDGKRSKGGKIQLSTPTQTIGAAPMQVALAWLLHRAPNILLIPGTSSPGHLRENMQAAQLSLRDEVRAELDAIGRRDAAA